MVYNVWQYDVRPGMEAELEALIGPEGAWYDAAHRVPGFYCTRLLKNEDGTSMVSMDKWNKAHFAGLVQERNSGRNSPIHEQLMALVRENAELIVHRRELGWFYSSSSCYLGGHHPPWVAELFLLSPHYNQLWKAGVLVESNVPVVSSLQYSHEALGQRLFREAGDTMLLLEQGWGPAGNPIPSGTFPKVRKRLRPAEKLARICEIERLGMFTEVK